jgi:hypothetical protein
MSWTQGHIMLTIPSSNLPSTSEHSSSGEGTAAATQLRLDTLNDTSIDSTDHQLLLVWQESRQRSQKRSAQRMERSNWSALCFSQEVKSTWEVGCRTIKCSSLLLWAHSTRLLYVSWDSSFDPKCCARCLLLCMVIRYKILVRNPYNASGAKCVRGSHWSGRLNDQIRNRKFDGTEPEQTDSREYLNS